MGAEEPSCNSVFNTHFDTGHVIGVAMQRATEQDTIISLVQARSPVALIQVHHVPLSKG